MLANLLFDLKANHIQNGCLPARFLRPALLLGPDGDLVA